MSQVKTNGISSQNGDERDSRLQQLIAEIEDLSQVLNTNNGKQGHTFKHSPRFVRNGVLHDYQLEGLNWLISLYEYGICGILADEMGLGKTLQTIAFLGYLKHMRKVKSPHLIIAPKSTIHNWENEFQKWCPTLRLVAHRSAEKKERLKALSEKLLLGTFDVCLTSYELCMLDQFKLNKFDWHYLIVDEGHRIKNNKSRLFEILQTKFNSQQRLLITGTPIQNNLHELWSLLNFLMPEIFNSWHDFDHWFTMEDCLKNDEITRKLHKLLNPLMLQRTKATVTPEILPKKLLPVFVQLSAMQRDLYRHALMKRMHDLRSGKMSNGALNSIYMQLRKICNHPYLFDGLEPGPPYNTGMHLVQNSGKMMVLDQMLPALKAAGSRLLIFCQMTRMMDILEDYFEWRGYKFCRLDGKVSAQDRIASMEKFNRPRSDIFIFMLSTRAGGLGINLHTADVVIFYDSDFNPQVDLQVI